MRVWSNLTPRQQRHLLRRALGLGPREQPTPDQRRRVRLAYNAWWRRKPRNRRGSTLETYLRGRTPEGRRRLNLLDWNPARRIPESWLGRRDQPLRYRLVLVATWEEPSGGRELRSYGFSRTHNPTVGEMVGHILDSGQQVGGVGGSAFEGWSLTRVEFQRGWKRA